MPPFRKANSRSRCARVSKLKTTVSKIWVSGLKVTFVPRRFVVPGHLQRAGRSAAFVGLLVDLAVAPDLHFEYFRQGVHDRDADAVETAGNLVAVVVELAARMEDGQHHFGRGLPAGVLVDRNAAAVVDDRDRTVDVNRDVDLVAEASQGFVDGVVDDLVDEMVQTGRTGRPDVHRGPLPDRFEPFQDLDALGRIGRDVRSRAVAVVPGWNVARPRVALAAGRVLPCGRFLRARRIAEIVFVGMFHSCWFES